MAKRIELTRAPHGQARIETYVNGRRTHVSVSMARSAALIAADEYRAQGLEVIDHTQDGAGEEGK
jgi:hypothetical protein